jgi:hypothetical protein
VDGLCKKSEVLDHFKVFMKWAKVQIGKHVQHLHLDGGGKYTGGKFIKYLDERGIQHEITTPHTPQHNGVAGQINCTLLNKVQAMLTNANLPNSYWYNALKYATLLHNVSYTHMLNKLMLKEVWSGNKPIS